MAQKIVTFEVAKALKEAGYPQGNTDQCYLTADHNQFYKKGQIVDNEDGEWTVLTRNLADIPTYLSTWLWLWREKGIMVETSRVEDCVDVQVYTKDLECLYVDDQVYPDPEEAIAKAIDYLVENKLLK